MTTLLKLDQAYNALMVAHTIDEVKEIRDKMEALRLYFKQQNQSLEMQNICAEIRLRAERKMGKMLKEMPKNKGTKGQLNGRDSSGASIVSVPENTPTLADVGITHKQSSTFQTIADIPDESFEGQIARTKAAQEELTGAKMKKLARELKAKESYDQKGEEVIPDSTNHILADIRHVTLEQLGGIPFKAVILDPAWEFEAWDQKTGDEKSPDYDLMTIDDIYNLPVIQLADPDCLLLLWATNPFLPQALRAMETWGFSYRTKFPWIKTTLKNQKLDYGTGYWVRGVSEDILIGTRGNIAAPRSENFLGLIGPNIEHSRKPQDVHKMAESTTTGPYLELFSRYSRPGWVTVGNEYRGGRPADPIPSTSPPWLKSEDAETN